MKIAKGVGHATSRWSSSGCKGCARRRNVVLSHKSLSDDSYRNDGHEGQADCNAIDGEV